MNLLRRLAVVTVAIAYALVAQADPILVEGWCDGTANAGVTCDTSTGLEWLDLTATIGLSVNQFRADEGGWLSQGWGIANTTQVKTLYLDAGFSVVGGPFDSSNTDPALLMLDLLGCTSSRCDISGSFGQGYTVSPEGGRFFVSYYQVSGSPPDSGIAKFNSQSVEPSLNSMVEGIWAVWAPVSVPVPVAIDIKPGTEPDCGGAVPVAILGSDTLDVTQINPATLSYEGLDARQRNNGSLFCRVKDVNSDGYDDFLCQYQDMTTDGMLPGELLDGTPIEGVDTVCVVN
jgi:hypothetical protein